MTTLLPAHTRPVEPTTASPAVRRAITGARELGFLAVVYVGYAVTRVLADDSFAPARERAARLVAIEQPIGLGFEQALNDWFAGHDLVGAAGAFHYASAHYLVTAAVLVWLFVRRPSTYVIARRTLVVATMLALGVYLLAPTAPPRLVGGFTDVLAQHSGAGWWGAEASAPKGLGELTNQLAAFPSMHAGWALWVALAVAASTRHWFPRLIAWGHAVVTALVVIGTGNHWTLDVVAGWALIAFVWRLAEMPTRDEQIADSVILAARRR